MFVLDQIAHQGMAHGSAVDTEAVRAFASTATFFDMRGWLHLHRRQWASVGDEYASLIAGPAIHVPFHRVWMEIGRAFVPGDDVVATLRAAGIARPTTAQRAAAEQTVMAILLQDDGAFAETWGLMAAPGGAVCAVWMTRVAQDKELSLASYDDMGLSRGDLKAEWSDKDHFGVLCCTINALRMLDCKKQVRLSTENTIRERTRRRCGICVGTGFHVLHLRARAKDAEIELRERDDDPQHRPLPLFLVRGHYQTYTPEAPLFGKHIGRWWWAPQTRGDADNGIVLKSYRAKSGQAKEA